MGFIMIFGWAFRLITLVKDMYNKSDKLDDTKTSEEATLNEFSEPVGMMENAELNEINVGEEILGLQEDFSEAFRKAVTDHDITQVEMILKNHGDKISDEEINDRFLSSAFQVRVEVVELISLYAKERITQDCLQNSFVYTASNSRVKAFEKIWQFFEPRLSEEIVSIVMNHADERGEAKVLFKIFEIAGDKLPNKNFVSLLLHAAKHSSPDLMINIAHTFADQISPKNILEAFDKAMKFSRESEGAKRIFTTFNDKLPEDVIAQCFINAVKSNKAELTETILKLAGDRISKEVIVQEYKNSLDNKQEKLAEIIFATAGENFSPDISTEGLIKAANSGNEKMVEKILKSLGNNISSEKISDIYKNTLWGIYPNITDSIWDYAHEKLSSDAISAGLIRVLQQQRVDAFAKIMHYIEGKKGIKCDISQALSIAAKKGHTEGLSKLWQVFGEEYSVKNIFEAFCEGSFYGKSDTVIKLWELARDKITDASWIAKFSECFVFAASKANDFKLIQYALNNTPNVNFVNGSLKYLVQDKIIYIQHLDGILPDNRIKDSFTVDLLKFLIDQGYAFAEEEQTLVYNSALIEALNYYVEQTGKALPENVIAQLKESFWDQFPELYLRNELMSLPSKLTKLENLSHSKISIKDFSLEEVVEKLLKTSLTYAPDKNAQLAAVHLLDKYKLLAVDEHANNISVVGSKKVNETAQLHVPKLAKPFINKAIKQVIKDNKIESSEAKQLVHEFFTSNGNRFDYIEKLKPYIKALEKATSELDAFTYIYSKLYQTVSDEFALEIHALADHREIVPPLAQNFYVYKGVAGSFSDENLESMFRFGHKKLDSLPEGAGITKTAFNYIAAHYNYLPENTYGFRLGGNYVTVNKGVTYSYTDKNNGIIIKASLKKGDPTVCGPHVNFDELAPNLLRGEEIFSIVRFTNGQEEEIFNPYYVLPYGNEPTDILYSDLQCQAVGGKYNTPADYLNAHTKESVAQLREALYKAYSDFFDDTANVLAAQIVHEEL
jgi:hypothetical protein